MRVAVADYAIHDVHSRQSYRESLVHPGSAQFNDLNLQCIKRRRDQIVTYQCKASHTSQAPADAAWKELKAAMIRRN